MYGVAWEIPLHGQILTFSTKNKLEFTEIFSFACISTRSKHPKEERRGGKKKPSSIPFPPLSLPSYIQN